MQHSPKIVMPLTNESNAPLPSPHFNEEATVLSARPVVPLASSGNYVASLRATRGAPLVKRFLPLALIVAAAVGIGIAGGLALSRRHANQMEAKSAAAVANEPASSTANETSNPPVQYTATTAREKGLKPEMQTTMSGQPNDAPAARATTPVATASTATRDRHKQANVEPAPPQQISLPPAATRNRRAQEVSAPDESDARARDDEARAERRAARAERRRAQTAQPDAALPPLPRQVERATQQLNRIKDIFEGQKP